MNDILKAAREAAVRKEAVEGARTKEAQTQEELEADRTKRADAMRQDIRPVFDEALQAVQAVLGTGMVESTADGLLIGVDQLALNGSGQSVRSSLSADYLSDKLLKIDGRICGQPVARKHVAPQELRRAITEWVQAVIERRPARGAEESAGWR